MPPVINPPVPLETAVFLITRLGYSLRGPTEGGIYEFFHDNDECGPIRVMLGPITEIPMNILVQLLDDQGINPVAFYAAFESL